MMKMGERKSCDVGNVFPIAKVLRARGAAAVAKEAAIPAISVLFLLVPQSLAYALLAEVPPIYGLYASAFPLLVYSILGTSGQIAAGPVAMLSLLSADAVNALPNVAPGDTLAMVHALALLCGLFSVARPAAAGEHRAAALARGFGGLYHCRSHHHWLQSGQIRPRRAGGPPPLPDRDAC